MVDEGATFITTRLKDAQKVLSGLYKVDVIVVWTDDGLFDATPKGPHFVSYTVPGLIGEYVIQISFRHAGPLP